MVRARARAWGAALAAAVMLLCAGPLGASRKFKSEESRREEAGRLFDVAQAHRERGDAWQAANVVGAPRRMSACCSGALLRCGQ